MSQEANQKMVRFDFPPGATAEEIAVALTALRDRVRRGKVAAKARGQGQQPSSPDEERTPH